MRFNLLPNILATSALLAASLATVAHATSAESAYSGVVVFGDSLSDSGNNRIALGMNGGAPSSNTFVPTFPYAPSNTYSNGPTWVTSFAAGLGLAASSLPSLAGGSNYAFGGARVGGSAPFPPSLPSQLSGYLASGPSDANTALYVIAGGGNDVRDVGDAVANGADLMSSTLAGASAFAASTAQMVGQLHAAGALHIVVWNVPDLGKSPAAGAGDGPLAAAGSFIASTFNSFLSTALAGSGVTIFDTFGLVDNVVANPAAYGFGNVTQACGYPGNGCDASTALFWDGIHPTAFAHEYIASQMLAAVPEPSTYLLFTIGLFSLGTLARRRRA